MNYFSASSTPAAGFGAVGLKDALSTFSSDQFTHVTLFKTVGEDNAELVHNLIETGSFGGDVGILMKGFLANEIIKESRSVWCGFKIIFNEYIYMGINEYQGIFFVWVRGYENEGYFLNLEDPRNYLDQEWKPIKNTTNKRLPEQTSIVLAIDHI